MKLFSNIYKKQLMILENIFSFIFIPAGFAKPIVILLNIVEYIFLFLFIALFLISLYLKTDSGSQVLTTTVQKLLSLPKPASIPEFAIKLGSISLQDGIRLENFALYDSEGVWLEVEEAHVDLGLYKLPLVFFHLNIDTIAIKGVNYFRIPNTVPNKDKEHGWYVPNVVVPRPLGTISVDNIYIEEVFVATAGMRLEQFPLDINGDIRASAILENMQATLILNVVDKGLDKLGALENGAYVNAKLIYKPQELTVHVDALDNRWSRFFAHIGTVKLDAKAIIRAKELAPSKENPFTIELEGTSQLDNIAWLQRGIAPDLKAYFSFDGEDVSFRDVSAKGKDFSLFVSTFGINVDTKKFSPSNGHYSFDDLSIFLATLGGNAKGNIEFSGDVKNMLAKTQMLSQDFYLKTDTMRLSTLKETNIQADANIKVIETNKDSAKYVSPVNVAGSLLINSNSFSLGHEISVNPIDFKSDYLVDTRSLTFVKPEIFLKDMLITSPKIHLDITTASATTLPIFTGDVHLEAESFALFGTRFPIVGNGTLEAAFRGNKVQEISIKSDLENIAFYDTSISNLSLIARISEFNRSMLGEIPFFEGHLSSASLNYLGELPSVMPGRIYDKGTAKFIYSKEGIDLDISTIGNLQLDTQGLYKIDDSQIDIADLELNYAPTRQSLKLEEKTSINYSNGLVLSPLNLTAKGGRATSTLLAEASFKKDNVYLKTDLSLALELIRPYVSEIPIGLLDLEIDIHGATKDPKGIVNVHLNNFVPSGEDASFSLYGNVLNNHIVWNAGIEVEEVRELYSNGFIPISFSPYPQIKLKDPMFVHVDWEGDISTYWGLLSFYQQQASGKGMLDINITGSLSDSKMNGSAYLAKARFEDTVLNYVVTDIDSEIQIEPDFANLALRARDGTPEIKGREDNGVAFINAQLKKDENNVYQLEMKSALNTFSPIKSDELTVNVSGTLEAHGNVLKPNVTGNINVNHAAYVIPQDIVQSTTLRSLQNVNFIRNIDLPIISEIAPISIAFNPAFNINIAIPSVAQVNGFGLDSLWYGELTLVGDMLEPLLVGTLESAEGTFELLGKDFNLERSLIVFSGNMYTPIYNIIVERSNANIETTATISGSGGQIKIEFSSVPSMPLDEIIAQTIYAKPLAELSQFEAIQVATYAGQMLAPTYNPLTMIASTRDALGLQVLRLNSNDTYVTNQSLDGEEMETSVLNNITLEAGAYLSNQLYLGLERGVKDTAVRVELELFPNINANARLGTDTSQAGILWKRNY